MLADARAATALTSASRDARTDLRHALDAAAFAVEALHLVPDPWQVDVLRSSSRRILMCCSRQVGKSTIASVLALHRALFHQDSLILLISPSQRQSSELFRKVTDLLARVAVRPTLVEDNRLSLMLDNGSRVISLPSSPDTIRGYSGASLIVEDEAAFLPDDAYHAVTPMLATSGGRLVLMSTPFGCRGHFHAEWVGASLWERVSISALNCPRIARDFLEDERRSKGDWRFRQEYLCEFASADDALFTYDTVHAAVSADVQPMLFGAAPV